jgi:2-polyprenyl-3-methyl-5-hydroxy-6-metoxy-1,4-benzoquinol methylase
MTAEERLRRKNEFDGNLVAGVRQFNIKTRRDRHLDRRAAEAAKFVDPETGLLREELARVRGCPVCGSGEARELFVKAGFRHVKCRACDMVYVNPVLREERLHSFYMDEDSWTKVLMNEAQQELDRKKFAYGLDVIEEHVPERGRLLDVGCGPGVFLEVARERGWRVAGVEFNRWCLERLRGLEIEASDVPLEQAEEEPGSHECVTMFSVLEHIIEPGPMLAAAHRILVAGGVLLIEVPNIDGLASRLLHERSATFGGDSHVNFFNVRTLTRMLGGVGFEVLEAETLLTQLGTIDNYLSYEDPYFGQSERVLDFLTPEYIHGRMLGSRLLVLARARGARG